MNEGGIVPYNRNDYRFNRARALADAIGRFTWNYNKMKGWYKSYIQERKRRFPADMYKEEPRDRSVATTPAPQNKRMAGYKGRKYSKKRPTKKRSRGMKKRSFYIPNKGRVMRYKPSSNKGKLKIWRKKFFNSNQPLTDYPFGFYEELTNWSLPSGNQYAAVGNYVYSQNYIESYVKSLMKDPNTGAKRHMYISGLKFQMFMLNSTATTLKCEISLWKCKDLASYNDIFDKMKERDPQWSSIFDSSRRVSGYLKKKFVVSVDPGQQLTFNCFLPVKKFITLYRTNETTSEVLVSQIGLHAIIARVYSDAVTLYSTTPEEDGKFGFVQLKDDSFRLRCRRVMKIICDREAIQENALKQEPQGFILSDDSFHSLVPDFKVKTEDKLVADH